jgi:hypothetical protein
MDPQYVAAPIAPVLPPGNIWLTSGLPERRGRAMSTVQRDRLAIMLRLLLAVGLATSLSYCSTAIEQAKALFTCIRAPSAASTSQSPGCGHFSSGRGTTTRLDQRRDQGLRAGVGALGL